MSDNAAVLKNKSDKQLNSLLEKKLIKSLSTVTIMALSLISIHSGFHN